MKIDVPTPSRTCAASTIVAALHESRRRKAIKVIHRYRHLGPDRVEFDRCESIPSAHAKTQARRIPNSEKGRTVKRLSETHLMILILMGFGVVHVIGGVLMARTAPEQGNPPLVVATWRD